MGWKPFSFSRIASRIVSEGVAPAFNFDPQWVIPPRDDDKNVPIVLVFSTLGDMFPEAVNPGLPGIDTTTPEAFDDLQLPRMP